MKRATQQINKKNPRGNKVVLASPSSSPLFAPSSASQAIPRSNSPPYSAAATPPPPHQDRATLGFGDSIDSGSFEVIISCFGVRFGS
ncbi:hypothetical protein AKJ16_DCAP17994 [Drosera capensis]